MNRRCLYCYKPLITIELDFHAACSKKMFGTGSQPELPFDEDQLGELAQKIIQASTTVTGVQPKISLNLPTTNGPNTVGRFTLVGLWGNYILKPPTLNYPELPEVEDLTMHLAAIARIKVVPHSLIRLSSGNLAYITRRIDRTKKGKLHMEDMCQLTGRLTEDKYNGSYEQIAKAIQKYSATPGLDLINFFEVVLFSFITGNADMHLKNFSLINDPGVGMIFSPAYDLVATKLVNRADDEELALTLNGKKKRIKKADFITAFNNSKLSDKQQQNMFNKMIRTKEQWKDMITSSFLSQDFKDQFTGLLKAQLDKIR
ncbi:type II toxin-antitoxin system HipA family toxin [Segetibacter sp. 3557_3]|uniref:HipA domain-containing protein n=1 Tax=Segetibacter sp. 3557_3 TaxID=2547429 RepID=UPI0010586D10|nr:HipA domain-containing protein [Segetibacter sp. 3557_3]TDH23972.1 type II toxin-antitoxin system HipA family toxin [Segetibacter sp. 3557_3]